MAKTFTEVYEELEHLDLTRDLESRYFHVSREDFSFHDLVGSEIQNRISDLDKTQLLDLYYFLMLTRGTDEAISKLCLQGIAFGKHLLSKGNEATAVGAAYALEKQDWMAPAIRDLGAFLVRGLTSYDMLAQACGRVTSPTKGRDASLHLGSRDSHIIGLISHLGTMPIVAIGCAFAQNYKNQNGIVLSFCGDGASSSGDVHEALNIASVLDLPFILVFENNQWAFGTPSQLQFKTPTLALRALGYGPNVEGYLVDGTNVLTVYGVVKLAIEKARKNFGKRPATISIIEAVSMRLAGHSFTDRVDYVPQEQFKKWEAKDPILNYRKFILDQKIADVSELEEKDEYVKKELEEATELVKKESQPKSTAQELEGSILVSTPSQSRILSEPISRGDFITYGQAIHCGINEEMARNSDVFIVGLDEGIKGGAFGITKDLLEKYDGIDWQKSWQHPEKFRQRRVIDVPLAESGYCGLAAGASLNGLRPIVGFQYADFSTEADKMLTNFFPTQAFRNLGRMPAVFRMPSGWTSNAGPFHSSNPESKFASVPGLKIVAPITAFDAKGLLKAAVRDGNPVIFLEYKAYYNYKPHQLPEELNLPVPEEDYIVPIGKARVIKTGKSMTVISYGSQLFRVLEAVHFIEKEDPNISIEVIDLRSIKPYDKECIQKSVEKTNRVLVTCEAQKTHCFGTEIVTYLTENVFYSLDAPVALVAALDTPVPFSPSLERVHLPITEKLIEAIRGLLKE